MLLSHHATLNAAPTQSSQDDALTPRGFGRPHDPWYSFSLRFDDRKKIEDGNSHGVISASSHSYEAHTQVNPVDIEDIWYSQLGGTMMYSTTTTSW